MIDPIDSLILAPVAGLSLWCAWTDLARRRIPNAAVLVLAALYPAAHAAGALPGAWWAGVLVGGLLFALGLVGFALGTLGGGDVKLAAALGLWAGSSDLAGFALVTALAGAGLSLAILATRNVPFGNLLSSPLQAGPQTDGHVPRESVPYGVALAAGGLWIAYGLIAA
ncbi:MAG: prepilin peptidase [Rhodovibrio sp.]|nr:prepilin peptidase [Rhodovibrio sp.]